MAGNPLAGGARRTPTTTLTALFLVLLLAAAAAGIGSRILRALGLWDEPLSDRGVFTVAIGLGAIAYGILALGVLQLFRPLPMGIVLAGFAALGTGPAVAMAREAGRALRADARGIRAPAVAAGGAMCLLLLMALVAALAPPAGNDWDGLSYHLADPAIYLRRGGIAYLFWESHSNFPFTVEMLYTVALLVKSPGAARAIHGLYLLLACLTLAAAWRRLWPEAPSGARWLAPLFLCSTPVVLWSATVAYNDLALTAYELLALYGVVLWARTGKSGWLWAGALALGFALGTKMTAMVQVGLLAPVVLFAPGVMERLRDRALVHLNRNRNRNRNRNPEVARTAAPDAAPETPITITKNDYDYEPESSGLGKRVLPGAVKRVLAWGGIAVAVASPWYVKSYLFTLNPVYPFFFNLFPKTRCWSAEIAASYAHHQAEFGAGHGWQHLLAVPWELLLNQARFTDGPEGFRVLFGSLGPIFLALVPAVLILRRRDPLALGALLYAGAYGLVWFHLTQQTRHLMPVVPLLALVSARGLVGLIEERRVARFPAFAAVGAQVAHAALIAWLMAGPAWPVVAGQQQPGEYLRRSLDIYPVCEYVNEYLPKDARLLLVHEVRGYYLERDYLWGNEGHHVGIPWSSFQDEAAARRYLRREMGVTHVLVNHRIEARDAQPTGWERTLWEAIRAGTLSPVYDDERGFWVYEVEP